VGYQEKAKGKEERRSEKIQRRCVW